MRRLLPFVIILLLAVTASIAVGIFVSRNSSPAPIRTPIISGTDDYLDLVNTVRAKSGVGTLQADMTLDDSAKTKANDMINKGYYAHDSPEGVKWYDMIRSVRPQQTELGENLSECGLDSDETMQSLIDSPGHFETMIRPQYKYFGTYSAINPKDGCMVVVHQFSS